MSEPTDDVVTRLSDEIRSTVPAEPQHPSYDHITLNVGDAAVLLSLCRAAVKWRRGTDEHDTKDLVSAVDALSEVSS